jgi:Spy/CpxP family protein refolding chaperone
MRKIFLVVMALLVSAPAFASAQQQPPTPPQPDSLRPRMMQRWQGRQPMPGVRMAPRFQGQWGRVAPRAQWGPGGVMPRAGMVRRAPFAPGQQFRGQRFVQPGFAQPGFAPRGFGPGQGAGLIGPGLREELKLTDEQVKRLDAIRDEVRKDNEKLMDQVRDQRRAQMEQLRAQQKTLLEQRAKAHEQAMERVKQVLTPEQQKQLDELRARRPMQRRQLDR